MILSDGKHVKGIFVYNPDIEYELGDFIVEEDCIYICKSGMPISGVLPSSSPDYYSPYPGSMITTIEEYENSNSEQEDKYISSNILSGILQKQYFGFGDSGVISSYIKLKDKKYNLDTELINLLGKTAGNITKPLDLLMREPEVNNACVQVSRNLLGVKDLVINTGEDNCLLRQYTYNDLNDYGDTSGTVYTEYRYRVQELVDVTNGVSYFRYTKGSKKSSMNTWQYNNTISSWTCTTVSKALLDKVNQIINYYNNEAIGNESVSSGFNFMNLSLANGTTNVCTLLSVTDDGNGGEYNCKTTIKDFRLTPLLLTINLNVSVEGFSNIYRSHTCTLNTLDTALKSDGEAIDFYYLEPDVLLKVEYSNTVGGRIILSLVTKDRSNRTDLARIISIYYRNDV